MALRSVPWRARPRVTGPRGAALARCAGGLASGACLLSVHLEPQALVCSANGVVDCATVLHSSYAEVLGVPVAGFGLAWFAVMALLLLRPVDGLTLAWSLVGVATVLWLLYVELFRIDRICLWCTAAHVLVVVIFACVLLSAPRVEAAR